MNVTVVSHFRNAIGYLERYFEQMDNLRDALASQGDGLTLVLGYGDSTDGTPEALFDECCNRFHAHLVDVSHGGPYLGSIVHPQRFKQLAYVGNKLWSNIPKDADIVGLVESDLIWREEHLMPLVKAAQNGYMVAPMVHHIDGRFYDTWAFRSGGMAFTNEFPYHPFLGTPSRYLSMDSVGSVFFMKAEDAKKICWPEKDVVVGFCRQAVALGIEIELDTHVQVYHP